MHVGRLLRGCHSAGPVERGPAATLRVRHFVHRGWGATMWPTVTCRCRTPGPGRGGSGASAGSACGDVLHQLVPVLLELADPALHHVADADDPAQSTVLDDRDMADPVLGHEVHDRL